MDDDSNPHYLEYSMTRHPQRSDTDAKRKAKMKTYAHKCSHAKNTDLNIGVKVLITQPKKDKMCKPFKPEPLEIKDNKGSMITAQNKEHTVTRNASFFKKLPFNVLLAPNDEEQSTTPTGAAEAVEQVTPADPVEPVEEVGSSKSPALRRSQEQGECLNISRTILL